MTFEEDEDDDLGIELGDAESPDDAIGGEYVDSRAVTVTQGINIDALAEATKIGIDDSIIRHALVLLEETRQFYGPKDESLARTCEELDATIRMIVTLFVKRPDQVIASILRACPVDEWQEKIQPIEEVLQWAKGKIANQ